MKAACFLHLICTLQWLLLITFLLDLIYYNILASVRLSPSLTIRAPETCVPRLMRRVRVLL